MGIISLNWKRPLLRRKTTLASQPSFTWLLKKGGAIIPLRAILLVFTACQLTEASPPLSPIAKSSAGRCCVFGNLDAIGLLAHGSEDELRTEITRQIAAGRRNGGRFVMSIGSPVTPGTTPERVKRYLDIAHELGSEG